MENTKNLVELERDISVKLLETISLLEIFEEIIDGENKAGTLLSIIKKNVTNAFKENEECRKKIYISD